MTMTTQMKSSRDFLAAYQMMKLVVTMTTMTTTTTTTMTMMYLKVDS